MNADTYTTEEFAEAFWRRGYGKKKQALKWLGENGIIVPSEDDFMRCYHDTQARPMYRHNCKYTALHLDGQNPVSASNTPNSSGKSFASQMAEELSEMDRLERWIKRRNEEAYR